MSWIHWKYFALNRYLHSSVVNREKDVSTNEGFEGGYDLNSVPLRPVDKRIFVWSGKYKRIEDVPDRANRAAVAKAQSVCRIKCCNYMILIVIIACGFYVMSGKKDAEKGISIAKMNEEWHNEYNKNYEERKKLNP